MNFSEVISSPLVTWDNKTITKVAYDDALISSFRFSMVEACVLPPGTTYNEAAHCVHDVDFDAKQNVGNDSP